MEWDIRNALPVLLLNVLVQSTVLLTLGLIAGRSLRRAGAAVQSSAYRAALVAVLLCPATSLLTASAGLGSLVIHLPPRAPRETVARPPAVDVASFPANPVPRGEPRVILPYEVPAAVASQPVATAAPVASAVMSWRPSAGALGLGVWFVGSALLLARLVVGQRRLDRLRASAVTAEPGVVALCSELAGAMDLAVPSVLRAPLLSSPCLVGLARPAILLPDDLGVGLRETLVHELAHLSRRDPLWHLIRRLATALFWVQPLLWVLSRRIEATAEEVCDDVVVHHGADRPDYAGHLLDLAERMLPPVAPASVGIVGARSSLGRRVRRILDATRPLSTRAGRRAVAAVTVIGLASTLAAGLLSIAGPAPARAKATGEAVSFIGRVVEKDGGKPVAGATVVVRRQPLVVVAGPPPTWAGDTTLHTAADGRFTVEFPPEQVAEPRMGVWITRVEHPDFIARTGGPIPLLALLRGREFGDKPFFDTIALERGIVYSGQVVTPEGRPAAGVKVTLGSWSWSNRSPHFSDATDFRTDADGRFRVVFPKTHSFQITVDPERYAPFLKYWGFDRPSEHPDYWAPTDLGRIVLEPGATLTGRVLDIDGRPVAGQRVMALGMRNRLHRAATTTADGSFRLDALRPGNYDVFAERQLHGPYYDPTEPVLPAPARPIRPARVFIRKGEQPTPVELRVVPAVRVEVRFLDAQGRPARGGPISLSGGIPGTDKNDGSPVGGFWLASAINEPEIEDTSKQLSWGCQSAPDAESRVVFHAPKGLQEAILITFPPDETVAYETRLVPGGPLKFWGGGRLGNLDADRAGIEIISYRAPTVFVSITTEGGEAVPSDVEARPGFQSNGGSFGENMVRQADGRFRTVSLMPDHAYEIAAWTKDYVPRTVVHLNLPEGATSNVGLVIRKRPKPPAVGTLAPAFSVKTTDGLIHTLAESHGKVLLLHFWSSYHGSDVDLARLAAIRKRYGADRLAMLGLCIESDESGVRAIREKASTWPQAILADRGADPIFLDYAAHVFPGVSFLIGPDGKLLARDLKGDQVDAALTKALGVK